jgi:hypothetical protein
MPAFLRADVLRSLETAFAENDYRAALRPFKGPQADLGPARSAGHTVRKHCGVREDLC